MTRFRYFLALVLAPLLVLSACSSGGSSSAAATINGKEISDSDFRSMLEMFVEHPNYAEALIGKPASTSGSEAKVDSAFAAEVLGLVILFELIDQEAANRSLVVAETDLANVTESFPAEVMAILDEIPTKDSQQFIRWNAQLQLIRDHVAAELGGTDEPISDDEIKAFYHENQELFNDQVCAHHILVDTEDEALTLIDQLEADGDIEELARDFSTDPSAAQNGGDLGCSSPSRYVPEFADAISTGEVGAVLGPVQTDFGYHVIRVDSRGVSLEDATDDIRANLESQREAGPQAAFAEAIQNLVDASTITVNAKYGRWDASFGGVVPPEGPSVTPTSTSQDLLPLG